MTNRFPHSAQVTSLLRIVTLLLVAVTFASSAAAQELSGVVIDAHTEQPAAGVRVVLEGLNQEVVTGSDGLYRLPLPAEVDDASIVIEQPRTGDLTWYVDQTPDRFAELRIFGEDTAPTEAMWFGVPPRERGEQPSDETVTIEDFLHPETSPLLYSVGTELPATIRVGRRDASSCAGNPVLRVEEVPLEEYVEGVLVPEIGVFQRVEGGPASAMENYAAFAIAARSYAIWFYLRDPGAEYHLDDTACNQRYESIRDPDIRPAVEATEGMIMVAASDGVTLDKLEYAASCGRHGSRPEYQDAIVPDITGQNACVGSWCGHNDCAAHQDHPDVPGTDRCLVRGICQWGGVERSMRGDTYEEIIAHYQPNVQIIRVGEDPVSRLVGYVRVGDVLSGSGVEGVTVTLDTGEESVTNGDGFFEFNDVEAGTRVLTYAGGGIVPASRDKVVEPGITNWASVAVELEGGDTPEPDDVGLPDAGASDAGGEDVGSADGGADDADAGTPAPDADESDSAQQDIGADANADAAVLADTRGADTSQTLEPPLSAVSIVPETGLGDTGCACSAGGGSQSRVPGTLLLFGFVGLAFRRGRS